MSEQPARLESEKVHAVLRLYPKLKITVSLEPVGMIEKRLCTQHIAQCLHARLFDLGITAVFRDLLSLIVDEIERRVVVGF